ncbi:hypothetical protein JXA84_00035 [candidate division WOR-3 bacterium]|nr:hypothetical protein [candidate division WOR-3 bacterium]
MAYAFLYLMVSFTVNPIISGDSRAYTIKDEPVYFSFEAQTTGYLSMVVKSDENNTDLTITARGPNTFFLDMTPSVIDIDAGGNTGLEQALFTIPSPGVYYFIVNPYTPLNNDQQFVMFSWFHETNNLIDFTEPIIIEENSIEDMQNLSGTLNTTKPLAVFQPRGYDGEKNLAFFRVEASEDVVFELYSEDNFVSYLLQSDLDIEGNAGIEELLYFTGSKKAFAVVKPYSLSDTTEIFFNLYFEALPPDDKLLLSSNQAVDEAYIDPENNSMAYIYELTIPDDGLSEVNLSSDDADMVLMAFSEDTFYVSDYDIDGNTGEEKLILTGGEYFMVVTNNQNSRQYADFTIEVVHHQDTDASRSNAIPLKLGIRNNGEITYENFDFQDYYVFTADQKATYTIESMGLTGEGDLIMSLENENGELLQQSDIDNNGNPTNEICTIELDRGDKIFVKVYPYAEYEGLFTDCQYYIVLTME